MTDSEPKKWIVQAHVFDLGQALESTVDPDGWFAEHSAGEHGKYPIAFDFLLASIDAADDAASAPHRSIMREVVDMAIRQWQRGDREKAIFTAIAAAMEMRPRGLVHDWEQLQRNANAREAQVTRLVERNKSRAIDGLSEWVAAHYERELHAAAENVSQAARNMTNQWNELHPEAATTRETMRAKINSARQNRL